MPVAEKPEIIQEENLLISIENAPKKPSFSIGRFIKYWLQVFTIAALLFVFTFTFLAQGFSVFGSCMEPNLVTGERVLGNKLVYRFSNPTRGDVIVFRYPKDPDKIFIKRVIAMPGETIRIAGGQVYIDGVPMSEPYLKHIPHGSYGPERIKPGNLFVMGDYRDQSNDSRYWGELPIQNVEAKAWVKYWPPNRAELLH